MATSMFLAYDLLAISCERVWALGTRTLEVVMYPHSIVSYRRPDHRRYVREIGMFVVPDISYPDLL